MRSSFRSVLKGLKKIHDFRVPAGALTFSSSFLESCHLTTNAEVFGFALRERIREVRHPNVLISDGSAAPADTSTFRVGNLADVLVILTTLIRGNFAGSIVLDLKRTSSLLTSIPPNLEVPRRDVSVLRMYELEVDKALRILRGRGVSVTSNVEAPVIEHAPHRNQVLNTTPTLVAIPNHKATLANYSTDNPNFLGYNYKYPDQISYTFNGSGYRNDFEHDTSDPYSLILGCSFVEGIGVPYEHTLSPQLGKLENRKVFALASHGGSISYMYRTFLNHFAQNPKKPVNVYAVFTEIHRLDAFDHDLWFKNDIYTTFSAWSDPKTMDYLCQVGVGFVYISAYLTYTFIKEYCEQNGITTSFAFYSYWNPSPGYYQHVYGEELGPRLWGSDFLDLGRDGLHPGKQELTKLSQQLHKGLGANTW